MTTSAPAPPRRRRLRRVLLALGSSVFALLLAEFAARWHVEGSFLEAVDSVLGLRTAEAPGAGAGLVADDELGFRLAPDLPGVNSRGVRHAEFPPVKPAGRFRTFLIGDSVGYPLDGFFADVAQQLASRSSHDLEFVNACVHGYTTWQERRFLERDLLDLQPDLVVLQYCVNDNHRFLHRLTSKGRRLLTLEAQEYLFPDGDGLLPWLSRRSYLVFLIRKAMLGQQTAGRREWQGIGRAAWSDATWPDQEENLRAIATALRERGAAFTVVAVPHEDQLEPSCLAEDAEFVCKPQRKLAAICARLEVPFLDLQPPMLGAREQRLFTDRLHLSAAGHRLVGHCLADFLAEKRLVPLQ